MVTDEQRKKDEAEFSAAFDEDMAVPAETSEDEAFGLTPEEVPGDAAPEQEAAVAVTDGEAEAAADQSEADAAMTGEAAPEVPEGESADAEALPVEGAEALEGSGEDDVPPEDMQRYKSWVGRLKKREDELAAREAALTSGSEAGAGDAGPDKAELLEAATEEVSEIMASSGSAEEAIERVSNDFGSDFVQMLKLIAEKFAGEAVSSKSGELQEALAALQSGAEDRDRAEHFEFITDHHPDFFEVADSREFSDFVKEKPEYQACCEKGSKRAVVKMLSAFKDAQNQANNTDNDDGLDDAAGVRSSGLALPEEAKQGKAGFEDAWEQF